VRPIREIRIWNRTPANATKIAASLLIPNVSIVQASNLDEQVGWADIISSATISTEPLIKGALLKPGTHVDLVGAFTPEMRESDDDAVKRSKIFVDTRAGATKEAGDIVQPLSSRTISLDDIVADLHELARGEKIGRQSDDDITLFKSVGAALEDLAAGVAVYEALQGSSED
jgi:ornithine cyclodeaminase